MASAKTKSSAEIKPPEDRRMRRARLIRDGMSWRKACLLAGYSRSVADRGPRGYMDGNDGHRRPGIMKDFERAAAESPWKPELLKKIARHRLATAVVEGRSSGVAREVELLGKFKEHDWWTSAGNTGPVGVWAVINDPEVGASLDQVYATLNNYDDGGSFACAWCHEEQSSREALQSHALICEKKPITILSTT